MPSALRSYVRAVCEGMQGLPPEDLTIVHGPGLEYSGADFVVVASSGEAAGPRTLQYGRAVLNQGELPSDVDPSGVAGYLLLQLRPGGKGHVLAVDVRPELRRRGIASAMYEYAERELGVVIAPSAAQTRDGKAFWRARRAA